ncbi:hypothetical protein P154DRAFT_622864 [Amniculicola lignicola CBS 123094]|uniref:Uncharacterized protein n=1 Tax=Amniculicola lignicola CBS 123094 TaxID=1392246 RepID=A0A6A5W848_9PLEO|nr:hypothetical protein P154DRAFT_622864 [Amniculicola lignicola CBS 123094]
MSNNASIPSPRKRKFADDDMIDLCGYRYANTLMDPPTKRRKLEPSPVGDCPFFSRLNTDVRNIIYDHMLSTPDAPNINQYRGFYMSSKQAKRELDIAMARETWMYLQEWKEKECNKKQVYGTNACGIGLPPFISSTDCIGLQDLTITVPFALYLSLVVPNIWCNRLRIHITGVPSDVHSVVNTGDDLIHWMRDTLLISFHEDLRCKDFCVTWNFTGEPPQERKLDGFIYSYEPGIPCPFERDSHSYFESKPAYYEADTQSGLVGVCGIYASRHWIYTSPYIPTMGPHIFFYTPLGRNQRILEEELDSTKAEETFAWI